MVQNIFRVYDIVEFEKDPSVIFNDWEPFCQNPNGVFVETTFMDKPPTLPPKLAELVEKLRDFVPEEETMDKPDAPFNGKVYYLRKVISEIRRRGEECGCQLEFGPSDYRTFLATDGMDYKWSEKLGIVEDFISPSLWGQKWDSNPTDIGFFENSFGINALITALDRDGKRKALFCERSKKVAVCLEGTVGSMDEGLRRAYKNQLKDETSDTNPAPNIEKAFFRGLDEEVGIKESDIGKAKPILLSVGRVLSLRQPAALYYLPLEIPIEKVNHCIATAKDKILELGEIHWVDFNYDAIKKFIIRQYNTYPVSSWAAVMAMYALRTEILITPTVFISCSSKDQKFAERLYTDLQNNGVRCWYAPEDLKIGKKIRNGIDESIQKQDKLLLVLSENSVLSVWVEQEVETALNREHEEKKLVLFPIRLDDTIMSINTGWPSLIKNTRNIGDFRFWNDDSFYHKALSRLLRDLKADDETNS